MNETPRTDAYPTKLVERSIEEALHPKGMSTHSGKVSLDSSHVLHILAVSRSIERDLNAANFLLSAFTKITTARWRSLPADSHEKKTLNAARALLKGKA
jgi:hypothetical protein